MCRPSREREVPDLDAGHGGQRRVGLGRDGLGGRSQRLQGEQGGADGNRGPHGNLHGDAIVERPSRVTPADCPAGLHYDRILQPYVVSAFRRTVVRLRKAFD